MVKPTESEFVHHVRKEFAYLKEQWGLHEVKTKEPFNVVFQNKNVFVSIRGVDFGAGTEVRIGQPPYVDRKSGWPLWLIIDVRDPSRHPKSLWDWGGQLKQASDGSRDLRDLCQDFLSGNFSEKDLFDLTLEKWRQSQIDAWKEHDREIEHIEAVNKATEAFRRREFESVVNYLEKVIELLTPAELKKLEFARKKLKS